MPTSCVAAARSRDFNDNTTLSDNKSLAQIIQLLNDTYKAQSKLDGVATLMTDPPCGNSTPPRNSPYLLNLSLNCFGFGTKYMAGPRTPNSIFLRFGGLYCLI